MKAVSRFFEKRATNLRKNPLDRVKAFQNKIGKEVNGLEDEKIVELFRHREEDAIRQTAEKYGARLRALSFRITADKQTAEECENDTYLEAWNRIPPNAPDAYLFAFLARITRHLSIDRCRERVSLKRDGALVELSDELAACLPATDDVDSAMDAKWLGEAISRFLRTLPGEKRVIFLRRYFDLDSISEISRTLSVSESKVKSVLFRLRADLRNFLTKEGYSL